MLNKDDREFDELCAKIAEGQVSAKDINTAFDLLDQDIDNFSDHLADKLNKQK